MLGLDLDFSNRTVLVVGGASGIGNGIAHAFRTRGAKVHVWGTREQATDYSASEGSDLSDLDYTSVDVTDGIALEKAALFETLDVLVLCQGTVSYQRAEFEIETFERVVSVNLNSMMACALKFRSKLAESRGSLILISSTAAFRTTYGNPAYNASKAGILGLTRALAQAWIGEGIRINGVAPGLVDTKLTKITTAHPDRLAASLKQIPAQRLGTPKDIAGAVLYLASPLADYVIGQTICVDGGGSL